jgi:hypothetical protein
VTTAESRAQRTEQALQKAERALKAAEAQAEADRQAREVARAEVKAVTKDRQHLTAELARQGKQHLQSEALLAALQATLLGLREEMQRRAQRDRPSPVRRTRRTAKTVG